MNSSGPRHAALRETESGCLAIADISGYTSYLAGAELDHAQDVLEDLTETVVRELSPPMTLSKLEGDAVFVYVPGSRPAHAAPCRRGREHRAGRWLDPGPA